MADARLLRLETIRNACEIMPSSAMAHGWMAMLCRHAAEYSAPAEASTWVGKCEASARRALAIDPAQPLARVAPISVSPLYGRWTTSRDMLTEILADHPNEPVAAHDLSVLDMATGQIRAAKKTRDRLIAKDPFATNYCYKTVYQNWSVGDFAAMDHAADRAVALWPLHPAVWTVRLWTLAFTGRLPAAREMIEHSVKPALPQATLAYLKQILAAVTGGDSRARDQAVAASIAAARNGPAHAIAAMFALSLLDRTDDLFDVASAYFFRDGLSPVPLHHGADEPALNEQHRRLTQILFTPVFAGLRGDPRFKSICSRTGLTQYWDKTGLRPDFETTKAH